MTHGKIYWRCVEDKFGYCSGTPDWEVEPHIEGGDDGKVGILIGGKCKRDPKTCKKYQTINQSLKARDKGVKKNAKQN